MFKILNPIWLIKNFLTLQISMGGDAPSQPTNQTVTQVSIPEYIRPSVERLIGKAEALTDINQNPYKTYGGQRIADFSPMQQRAFSDVGNMQTSSQLGAASNLAGHAGLGSYNLAGQMANAGNNYYGMATNPYATQAFMNPYLQNALNPMLDESRRQYGITGAQQQGNATRSGAFGGSREALMASENNRNMNTAMNQMIGQGYNTAFDQAQKNIQFGAGLGLQGQQGALQGYGQANNAASILGQLGQTQFGQQQAINQAQQNVGAIQQAQAQQGLDQRYQDFLKQQNYPYQQLAFMSDMQRGLPLSQSATSMYQAPPSTISQLGGLGMAGLGIYGASGGFRNNKAGGVIKEYKAGGLTAVDGYAPGGKIDLKSEEELKAIITNPRSNPLEVAFAEEQLMLRNRMKNNPRTAEIMGQSRAGIDSIATGDMVPEGEPMMAGGGIIAFKTGNEVKSRVPIPTKIETYLDKLQTDYDAELKNLQGDQFGKSQTQQKAIEAEMAANKEQAPWMALANAGFGAMAGTSPYGLTNIGEGAKAGLASYAKSNADDSANRKLLLQQQVEQEKAEFARRAQLAGMKQGSITNLMNKELGLQQIKATNSASAGQRDLANITKLQNVFETAVSRRMKEITTEKKINTFNPNFDWTPYRNQAIEEVTERFSRIPQIRDALGLGLAGPTPKPDVSPANLGTNIPLPKVGAPISKPIALPQMADKSKLAASLVVGQEYLTNGGTRSGVWDGTQFIPTNRSIN